MSPSMRLAVPLFLALAGPASAELAVPAPGADREPASERLDHAVTGPAGASAEPVAKPAPAAGTRALLVAAMGVTIAAQGEDGDEDGLLAHAEHAATRSPMPFDIIRSLQFLQDQIARGNDRGIRVQALLLRRFGPTFLNASDEVWTDARNRRAAVLFVLSGGPPEILRTLMRRGVLVEEETTLFEGALAYVENDLERAGELLSAVDLAHMEPGLSAHINLVLGQIGETRDPPEAMRRLDRARLLAPGGLIEEAALRIEVLLVEDLGEPQRADFLARQYFDRFHRSSYAGNFEARFVAVQARRGKDDPQAAIGKLVDILGGLPDPRRQRILLAVGRRALVEGNLPFAGLSAAEALSLEPISPGDRERARLYLMASTLAAMDPAKVSDELDALDRSLLVAEDLPLLDAAYRVLGAITTRPVASAAGDAPEAASLPVIDRATRLLAEIEADLEKNP